MDLTIQYATALLMLSIGAVLGGTYDIYRTALREWRYLRRLSRLFDFLFWVFALLLVWTALLGINDGDVRLIEFFLLLAGYFVYYRTLHKVVVSSTRLLIRAVYVVLRGIWHVIVRMVVRPLVWLYTFMRRWLQRADASLAAIEPVVAWPAVQVVKGATVGAKKYVVPFAKVVKEHWTTLANKYCTVLVKLLWPLDDDET